MVWSLHISKYKLFFVFMAFFISLIVANRGETRDTAMYIQVFNNIFSYSLLSPLEFYTEAHVEIGFGWLAIIVRSLDISVPGFFFIISFLTFLTFYKIVIELSSSNTQKYFIFFLLYYLSTSYFLMQQFMQIRQALSIPLAFLAITYFFTRKNLLLFIIFSLLAVSFHQSSIAVIFCGFFICVFVGKTGLSLKNFKFVLMLYFLISIFILKFLVLDLLIQYSNRLIAYSYSNYSEARELFALPNIKSLVLFLLTIVMLNKKLYANKLLIVFIILYTTGVAIRLGFSDFGILSGRLGVAFSLSETFIIPLLFFRFKNLRWLVFLILILMQSIITYGYQAPYIIEDYFKPL